MKPIYGFAAVICLFGTAPALPAQTQQANIDAACSGVLGAPCSTPGSPLNGTYDAVATQIRSGKLTSDTGSIIQYLINMVRSPAGWQANVIDSAWVAARCQGPPAEFQWEHLNGGGPGQWQTGPAYSEGRPRPA